MIIEERMSAYLDCLVPPLPDYLEMLEAQAKSDAVPIIRKQTQALLEFLLEERKPCRILEIGTAVGFSALLMAEFSPKDTKITTIEKVPARIQKAKENFAKYDSEGKITLIEADAVQMLEQMAIGQEKSFDFIFMDAAKGQYQKFHEAALRLLTDTGLLVADNVLQEGEVVESRYAVTRRDRTIHGRMREYLYQLMHQPDLVSTILPIGDGVALCVKRSGSGAIER